MAKTNDRWSELRLKRELKEYDDLASERARNEELEVLLKEGETNLWKVGRVLSETAEWPAARGLSAVLSGKADGWRDLALAFRRAAVLVAVVVRRYDLAAVSPDPQARAAAIPLNNMELNRACRILLQAIAQGEDRFAHWCGQRLVQTLGTGGGLVGDEGCWTLSPVEAFTVGLYDRWSNRGASTSAYFVKKQKYVLNSDAFRQALASWNDPSAFAAALDGIVEFRSKYYGKDYFALDFLPASLFPVEFAALERVRTEQGLPMPRPAHPLLNTPLMNPPRPVAAPDDKTLDRVLAYLGERLPGFVVPWDA